MRLLKRLLLTGLLALGLAGCKVELYSGLPEKQGNEILAVLLTHGVDTVKASGKEHTVSLMVEESQVAAAVEILRRNGYPRDDFASMGQIFKKEGLISSPLEERIRYIFGLSQSISETLSQIDGVITARVHIVLPEEQPLDDRIRPSSASVFIKYRPGMGLEEKVPQIKMIVQNSVEGLAYDKISVALFQAREMEEPPPEQVRLSRVLGLELAPESVESFWLMVAGAGTVLFLVLAGSGLFLWRLRGRKAQDAAGE